MKHTLLFLALFVAQFATAQSYISTSGSMKVDAGIRQFDSPNIYVIGCYNPQQQTWTVDLQFVDTSSFENVGFNYSIIFTKAQVNAFTGTGTGDTEKAQNALEQTVVDYLEGINGAIFTIN